MSKKVKTPVVESSQMPPSSFLGRLRPRDGFILSGIFLLLLLVIFYKPYVIDRLEPAGGDGLASVAQNQWINDQQKELGEIALWNPSTFLGVPIYCFVGPRSFNLDYLIAKLNPLIDWKLGWFIIGATGFFLILNWLGFPWHLSLIAVIAFLFYPHYQALINVGHFAKVRAVFALPMVVFGFLYLIRKNNWVAMLIFALGLSLQLRTQHYQVIFYSLLLIMTIGIWQIVVWIKEKAYTRLRKTLGYFAGSLVLSICMSAQPLFVANEYTPYSTRGGQAVKLQEESVENQVKSGGVTFDYATRWSLHPQELATLVVPRFFGGTSQEPYTGKAYPQLRDRFIPGYWGDMPFTQSSEYMGILIVILAILGFWYFRRNGFIISLAVLLVFAILLAFGRHFPLLYKTLFLHLPYFSKFRVPSMILILVDFILVIMSGYGLKGLLEDFNQQKYKAALRVAGAFLGFGLLFLFAPGILSYTSAQDAQYMNNPQVIEMLRTARREFLQADVLRMTLIVGIFMAMLVAYRLGKIRADFVAIGVFLIVTVDMVGISRRFLRPEELVDRRSLERRYFAETRFDRLMQQDKELYRVFGLGNLFQSNDLAYRHQIVTGYSPIKPQLIQDLMDNNLFYGGRGDRFNWPVINMLNARYLLVPGMLNEPNLTVLDVDQSSKMVLYLNEEALPRAFFVKKVQRMPDARAVLSYMNTADFDPQVLALTTEPVDSLVNWDTGGSVEITTYTPNRIVLNVETEGRAFLVLSEAYYPKGWQALVAGKETHILQVNHVLRGIEVPAGRYEIQFIFQPRSYTLARRISAIANSFVWLILLSYLGYQRRSSIRSFFQRKLPGS